MMITVFTDFADAEQIRQTADNKFEVKAFSETDKEAFRLEIGLENSSEQTEEITLNIIWPTKPFSELRDCFYWNNTPDADWIPIFAATSPGKSVVKLAVQPGSGLLCLHPRYSCGDAEEFLYSIAHPEANVEVFGKSRNDRNMTLLRVGNSASPRFRYLFSARNHANETSGCYCIEGMIEWLLSDDALARYALKIAEFTFVPVSNPDGVAEGMARFTGPHCADMNRDADWNAKNTPGSMPDSGHAAYFNLIDTVRPTHFINLHSYLFKFKDEIYAPDQAAAERFIKFMPDQTEFGKTWKVKIIDHATFPTGYAHEKYGSIPFLLEIPWFGRNAADMRETGKRIIRAAILMNSIQSDSPWGNL